MADSVFEALTEKLEESVAVATRALTAGKCTDYAEYQYLCGQIRGLKVAQSAIEDLSRAYMEADNE